MSALRLWWSFLWRLTLLLFVLSFVLQPLTHLVLLAANDATAIKYRPTVASALIAILFWLAGALSPRFVRRVLWGERLSLSDAQWLTFCRVVAVVDIVFALANAVVANAASLDTWVNFKLFGALAVWFVGPLVISVVIVAGTKQSDSSSGTRDVGAGALSGAPQHNASLDATPRHEK